MLESVITEVTAIPMPTEASSFFETPKKMHRPRKTRQNEVVDDGRPDKQQDVFRHAASRSFFFASRFLLKIFMAPTR